MCVCVCVCVCVYQGNIFLLACTLYGDQCDRVRKRLSTMYQVVAADLQVKYNDVRARGFRSIDQQLNKTEKKTCVLASRFWSSPPSPKVHEHRRNKLH